MDLLNITDFTGFRLGIDGVHCNYKK